MEKEHTIEERPQKNRSGVPPLLQKGGAGAEKAAPAFPNFVFFFNFRGLSFFYFILRLTPSDFPLGGLSFFCFLVKA